jgi:iron complex outermembrane receptor protein
MKTRLLLASSALLAPIAALSIGVAPAWAQDENPSASSSVDTGEILVTARRREESIQDVPVAVVAFGQQALEDRQIRAEADLQRSVPGLTIRETEGSNQIAYSIRGQTIDAFTGSFLAVVPYVNEVQANGAGSSNFYDLQSIQVLKGPQGTLFGRNSTGGAVLVATSQPTNEIGGKFSVSYGNFNAVDFKGMINLPIIDDTILLRVAGNMARRDGYQKNIFLNAPVTRFGKQKKDSVRGTLTVKPSDSITNSTMVEYTKTGGNSTAVVPWSVNAPGSVDAVTGAPLASSAAFLYSPALDLVFGPGAWAAYLALHPGADPLGYTHATEAQRKMGPYKVNAFIDGKPFFHGSTTAVTNTTTIDLGTDTVVKNIFGYSKSRSHYNITEQGSPYYVQCTCNPFTNDYGNDERNRAISNELQLQGKAFGGNLEYIVGAFFYKARTGTHWPQNYFELLPWLPGSAPIGVTSSFLQHNTSKAVFAQASYDITPQLTFTVGGRYTWEKVSLRQLPDGNGLDPDGTGVADQFAKLGVKFKKPSWTVGLDYKPSDDLLIYIAHRGSWRSGGVNGVAPMYPTYSSDLANPGALFKPETAKDVEFGVKWGGDVGGRPAHFNVAIYKQWIKNVQRAQFPIIDRDGPGGEAPHSIATTINVPKATVQGFEIDAAIRPTDWLEIGGNMAHTKAKYTDNQVSIFGTIFDFNSYADTPSWAGTVYAAVTLPIGDENGEMKLRGDIYKQNRQFFSNNHYSITPGTRLPGYELINARLDWRNVLGSQFSAALFGTNLTNKGYYVGGLSQGASLGENSAAPGRPRMYGAEVSIEF